MFKAKFDNKSHSMVYILFYFKLLSRHRCYGIEKQLSYIITYSFVHFLNPFWWVYGHEAFMILVQKRTWAGLLSSLVRVNRKIEHVSVDHVLCQSNPIRWFFNDYSNLRYRKICFAPHFEKLLLSRLLHMEVVYIGTSHIKFQMSWFILLLWLKGFSDIIHRYRFYKIPVCLWGYQAISSRLEFDVAVFLPRSSFYDGHNKFER